MTTNGKTEETYIVDGFENKTGYNFYEEDESGAYKEVKIGKESDLWYSFDSDSGNFHIVPDESVRIRIRCKDGKKEIAISEWLKEDKLKNISETVKANEAVKEVKVPRSQICPTNGKEDYTHNHWYVCVKSKENEYLMSFNRLWCDDSDSDNKTFHIHNNFGQAQFMCYPRAHKQINLFQGKFELMYPSSGDDGEGRFNCESGYFVYNAPYNIDSDAKEIADCFAKFIKTREGNGRCKENEETT